MATESTTDAVHARGCPRENVAPSRAIGHLGYSYCRDCKRHVKDQETNDA